MSGDALFPELPFSMRPRAEAAAGDPQLRAFLKRATLVKDRGRRETLPAAFGDRVDAVRSLAARIRAHVLDHLDAYLERFVDAAERAGTQVHFAADAAEANRIVVDLARRIGARSCVKSKSMVTEETRLLAALEEIGCETVETDLGEFILQLDGDAPSHIVTPMIHKDRRAVARTFERELSAEYTEDPERLTRIARAHLRERYRRADLGVSGANFLVARSGAVVICTNEGNGRFCATVPPVHVVFAGIEKLVPGEEELAVLLALLARSSTSQPLTCYTQILAGPRRDGDRDGPRELHVVLIDNGRSAVLASDGRDVLRCIRCGACLNACPVYRVAGGHSYGSVYSGPVGAVLTPLLRGEAAYADLPQASSLCGACREACPVDIDLPRLLIRLRRSQVRAHIAPRSERRWMRLAARLLASRAGYGILSLALRFGLRGLARGSGWIRRAPGPLAGWTRERDLRAPAKTGFREWWRRTRG